MRGYDQASYGDGMADVYDEWYGDRPDTTAAVEALVRLAGDGAVLELGAGTGRLAIPLALAGLEVHALDASAAMLARLVAKPGGTLVTTHVGDMARDVPDGPFSLAFVAWNTLFSVPDEMDQRRTFAAVGARLAPGGRFVVETFVPDLDRAGDRVEVRDLAIDRVVLLVSRSDVAQQRAEGQFVELTAAGSVRLRPWSIRWAMVDELDEMAAAAGMSMEARWADWAGTTFGPHSDNHVTIYRVP